MSEPGIAPTIDIPDNGSYAMVAQACAMAIQDAVAYLRNTETVATSVIGVAQDMQLRTDNADMERVIASAQATIAAAIKNLDAVSSTVAKILRDFPQR
jgi:hypothetical protein